MSAQPVLLGNILGRLDAESDRQMLDTAFYESQDYRLLTQTTDKPIVVGRRGTGKSALAYRLHRDWTRDSKSWIVRLLPREDEMLGIRDALHPFGTKYSHVRAAAKLAWKYALLIAMAEPLTRHYKVKTSQAARTLEEYLERWPLPGASICCRLRSALGGQQWASATEEGRIADVAAHLRLDRLEDAVRASFAASGNRCCLIIDNLDEGYEPDDVGIGIVGGMVRAFTDLLKSHEACQGVVFIRDNVFRRLQRSDSDYTRNIEGCVLRLHWDERELFNFICERLRVAFGLSEVNNRRVWNACTSDDLQNMGGFSRCLQMTLYRPRDLLALLNAAYETAGRKNSTRIVLDDVRAGARDISEARLGDLLSEYRDVIPGLERVVAGFAHRSGRATFEDACACVDSVLADDKWEPAVQQDLALLGPAESYIRVLYGIGFLGIRDRTSGAYVFSHDGRAPSVAFEGAPEMLVHPCYWMGLDMAENPLDREAAEEIHDECDIEVRSEDREVRRRRVGQLIAELGRIHPGDEGWRAFEDWCLQALRIVFAGRLRHLEMKPNGANVQRRDIVGTNVAGHEVWRHIETRYHVREVVFEIKNYEELRTEDFRGLLSYLTGAYGDMGFFITRAEKWQLERDKELRWVREMWNGHEKLMVVLTGKVLCGLMGKLRSPQRYDAGSDLLSKILSTYERTYLGEPPGVRGQRGRRAGRRRG